MDQVARDYEGRAHFLFVYSREAHPDDYPDYPAHKSIEQKHEHARAMRHRHSTPRKILVDTLDGEVHRRYGGAPNMSFVVDHTGRVAFKAGWTVAPDIRAAVEEQLRLPELKRGANPSTYFVAAYYKEALSYHIMDP